jgi:hypothetical protein
MITKTLDGIARSLLGCNRFSRRRCSAAGAGPRHQTRAGGDRHSDAANPYHGGTRRRAGDPRRVPRHRHPGALGAHRGRACDGAAGQRARHRLPLKNRVTDVADFLDTLAIGAHSGGAPEKSSPSGCCTPWRAQSSAEAAGAASTRPPKSPRPVISDVQAQFEPDEFRQLVRLQR